MVIEKWSHNSSGEVGAEELSEKSNATWLVGANDLLSRLGIWKIWIEAFFAYQH